MPRSLIRLKITGGDLIGGGVLKKIITNFLIIDIFKETFKLIMPPTNERNAKLYRPFSTYNKKLLAASINRFLLLPSALTTSLSPSRADLGILYFLSISERENDSN